MIKCFLSHSSKDKESYVRLVADRLRKEITVLDEKTFEAGMSSMEEIAKGLDDSSLFVVFISDSALKSEWVQNELVGAKERLDAKQIRRIYPIIIESGIKYDDIRIPEWMRNSLNIQQILKPTVAARKINSRLLEISWGIHPRLKERKEIFVGRNDLINQIEERLDNFSQDPVIALIASGLPYIGRKSLLHAVLRKANIVRDSYELPFISLSTYDGIEDVILKILDFGMVDVDSREALNGGMPEKILFAKDIFSQLADQNEKILIEDRGTLVQYNGELVDWFEQILDHLAQKQKLTFCIASQFRVLPSLNRTNQKLFAIAVKEMNMSERNGLMTRYTKFHQFSLTKEDYSFFSNLLTGYPEQVLYAVDLIHESSLSEAKRQSHLIQQYSSDKAQVVLKNYKEDNNTLNFIYFLSKFEFISYTVLFDIVDQKTYRSILDSLLRNSICEQMGATSEYIRVNEVIRDFISRNRFEILPIFEQGIKKHIDNFLKNNNDDNKDISDYFFSIQEALRIRQNIPNDLLIPSILIKTMKQIYDEKHNYEDVIELADRVLQREKYLHANTVNHVRFIKCQSLARIKNSNGFFDEVKKISEPDRSFLCGFYYRLSGKYDQAEESLNNILNKNDRRRDPKVLSELTLVYMQSDEYEKAFDLAKENYINRSSNLINANNYFTCLIMKERSSENKSSKNKEELTHILERLTINPSNRAQEMSASMRARMIAYYEENEEKSFQLIEETIAKFPDTNYPLLTKADLATYFGNKEKLEEAITKLKRITSPKAQSYQAMIKYEAMLMAMQGDSYEAKQLIRKELPGMIGTALQRLNERIDHLAERR